jgi:hypothetical protein
VKPPKIFPAEGRAQKREKKRGERKEKKKKVSPARENPSSIKPDFTSTTRCSPSA